MPIRSGIPVEIVTIGVVNLVLDIIRLANAGFTNYRDFAAEALGVVVAAVTMAMISWKKRSGA